MSNSIDTKKISGFIDSELEKIIQKLMSISNFVLQNPEIGGKEYKALDILTKELKQHDFKIEKGIGGLQTSFKASINGKKPKPTLAIVSEYDAYPNFGHYYGNHINCVISLGTAIILSKLRNYFNGNIINLGTPASCSFGGKHVMLKNNAFKNLDACIALKSGDINTVAPLSLEINVLDFTFKGRAAHIVLSPTRGVNSLRAVFLLFHSLDDIEKKFEEHVYINGIILKGGEATNIIPETSVAQIEIRAKDIETLNKVVEKIKICAIGASLQSDTELFISMVEDPGRSIIQNKVLIEEYKNNMKLQNKKISSYPKIIGSSDIGKISRIIPTIYPVIDAGLKDELLENNNYLTIGRETEDSIKTGIKVLTLTGLKFLTDDSFRKLVLNEHKNIKD